MLDALGFSNRFLLGDGTMVPVDDADEAEELEPLGELGPTSQVSVEG